MDGYLDLAEESMDYDSDVDTDWTWCTWNVPEVIQRKSIS